MKLVCFLNTGHFLILGVTKFGDKRHNIKFNSKMLVLNALVAGVKFIMVNTVY